MSKIKMTFQKNKFNSLFLSILFIIPLVHLTKIKISSKFSPNNNNYCGKFDIDLHRIEYSPDQYQEFANHLNFFSPNKYSASLLQMKTEAYVELGLHKAPFAFYVGYIYVGNPPQIIPVVFDSGSGYTAFASKYCIKNKQCAGSEHYYNSDKSTSYKPINRDLNIIYGKGQLTGKLGRDVIALSRQIIMLSEPITEIENIQDRILQSGSVSGIVGLAYPSSSMFNHTFYDGLIETKSLDRNVIGFFFDKNMGKINFGYIDANKYQGEFNSHKVVDKYYWTLNLSDIKIGDKSINLCENNKCKTSIDTASSGIIVSPKIFEIFTKNLKVNLDCSNVKSLPNISFKIDDVEYSLEPKNYLLKYYNKQNKNRECALNMIPMKIPHFEENGKNELVVLLGENFIRNYYTVFDRDSDSVHFGLRKNKM
jgi:cathepsin D